MKKAIIAEKVGMTQIFNENAEVVPVTVLKAGPCYVVELKTMEKDGYEAVALGFKENKEVNTTKPMKAKFAKAGVGNLKVLKEFRLENCDSFALGATVTADIFEAGDKVDVHGVSKGKGFQGVIKRFNQHRGPMAHGSKYHRAVGSMGASSDPSRVFKGKHLPGHMGNVNVTVKNLTIVKADAENNLILVKGAVPGSNGSIITLTESRKGKKA